MYQQQKREMPEDFPALARGMTLSAAAAKWKTSTATIRRWATELGNGTHDAMRDNGIAGSRLAATHAARAMRSAHRIDDQVGFRDAEDVRAMRHLQLKKRWVCYSTRIHQDGKRKSGEIMYHVGNRKLTYGELIELAQQHGFD